MSKIIEGPWAQPTPEQDKMDAEDSAEFLRLSQALADLRALLESEFGCGFEGDRLSPVVERAGELLVALKCDLLCTKHSYASAVREREALRHQLAEAESETMGDAS